MNKIKINEWDVTVDICPDDNNLLITLQCEKDNKFFAKSFEFRVKDKQKIVAMDWNKLDDGVDTENAELT